MKTGYLYCITFFFLFLLSLVVWWNEVVYVVPGWHTMIYTKFSIPGFLVSFILMSETIIYWRIARKGFLVNPYFFIVHSVVTLPILIVALFPVLVFDIFHDGYRGYERIPSVFSATYLTFIAGQLVFCFVVLSALLYNRKSRFIRYRNN